VIGKSKTHTLYLSAGGLLAIDFDGDQARVTNQFDLPDGDSPLDQDLLTCADALAFRAWVESKPHANFQLLIDHVDEQHAIEKIPRLGLRDRAALIAKRFNQQFRDSEFRTSTRIPRLKDESRKEERLVMMALKSSVNFSPWLDVLLQAKARISLMTSPSLLSPQLIKLIAPGESGLIISHHPAGLRQTLIIDGTVRFSRLARLKAYDGANVRAEILRSIQYLTMTQRLAAPVLYDEKFTVWLLEDAIKDAHELPASLVLDSGSTVSIKRLKAEQLSMPLVSGAEGLSVWAALCQHQPGKLNYANKRIDIFQRIAVWRKRLWTGAAVVASAGLLLALLTDEIVSWHGDEMSMVRSETSKLQSRVAQLREQLSRFPTTPDDILAAVRVSERLAANEADPVKLLNIVSRAFVQTEGLSLTGISFSAQDASLISNAEGNSVGVAGGLGDSASETPSLLAGELRLIVSGMADRALTRTDANNQIRLLADELVRQCPCTTAQIDLPFDASAQSGLTASLNDQFSQNREFRIVFMHQQPASYKPGNLGNANATTALGPDQEQDSSLISAMSVSAMEAERE